MPLFQRRGGVGGRDVFGIVGDVAVRVERLPPLGAEVAVERFVVHVVVGVLRAGAQLPRLAEPLFECGVERRHVVKSPRAVVVGRVAHDAGGGRADETVVAVAAVVTAVIGHDFERRAERVDAPDVVEGGREGIDALRTVVEAFVAGQPLRFAEVGRRAVGRAVAVDVEVGLGADAVPFGDVEDRAGASAAAVVAAPHFGGGVEQCAARTVFGVFGGFRDMQRHDARPARSVEGPASCVAVERKRGVVAFDLPALARRERKVAREPVVALAAERDADDAGRRVGVVVGTGLRDDLDALDLLRFQPAQVVEQLLGGHAHFAVVDVDLDARCAVDGDLVVGEPDAGRLFEQFGAVLAERDGRACDLHDEPVGFAADETGLDDHLLHLDRRGMQYEFAQIARRIDVACERFVAEVLDRQAVPAGRDFERERPVCRGCRTRQLRFGVEQHDRGVGDGRAVRIDDPSRRRGLTGGRGVDGEGGEEQEQRHTEEILFHFPVVVCFDCYFTLQIYI